MIELRAADSNDELEAWRRVRIAVLPDERTASVAEMRAAATPDTLLLLAEVDGDVVGCGIAKHTDTGNGRAFVQPRVVPDARRQGVGSVLLRALAAHAQKVGYTSAGANVEDPGSVAFADRFGFREVGRQVEQVYVVRGTEVPPVLPAGIELVSLAERPDLHLRTYYELALEAFEDIPTPSPISITPELWEREWIALPEGSFVALGGGEIVGCAGLVRDADLPDRAENTLTAVRRDWRGRGVARALKESVVAWAAANGIRELYTWTQTGNESMRAVNEKLGYVTRDVAISVRRELPLDA